MVRVCVLETESPQGAYLQDRRNDLVIGVAKFVAARRHIFVAELVHADLDRGADESRDNLSVFDVVGLGDT